MTRFDGYHRVIFNQIPKAPSGDVQFIELENCRGYGVGIEWGGWVQNEKTGFTELHIPQHPAMPELYEALKGLGVSSGDKWCFCQHVDTVEHTDACSDAQYALALAEKEVSTRR